MQELAGKRVLVTGAADGIGKAAAFAFADAGCRMTLMDIDGEKLSAVAEELARAGADCASHVVDVSKADEVDALAARVVREQGGVDVLVNVAGVCEVADVVDTSLDDWQWLIGVNLYGPINTIRAFVPGMLERGSGHVLNVASVGGLVPIGMIGGYCTTKAALVALSASLSQEAFHRGVRVTAFCPGITNTGIVQRMRFREYDRGKMQSGTGRMMARATTAEKTGRLMVEAVRRERAVVVTGLTTRIVAFLNRVCPPLVRFVLMRGQKLNYRLYR